MGGYPDIGELAGATEPDRLEQVRSMPFRNKSTKLKGQEVGVTNGNENNSRAFGVPKWDGMGEGSR